jgi:hypothetical protein
MRNLEHVGAQVDVIGQHRLLRFELDVARQQDPLARDRRPHDDR